MMTTPSGRKLPLCLLWCEQPDMTFYPLFSSMENLCASTHRIATKIMSMQSDQIMLYLKLNETHETNPFHYLRVVQHHSLFRIRWFSN